MYSVNQAGKLCGKNVEYKGIQRAYELFSVNSESCGKKI